VGLLFAGPSVSSTCGTEGGAYGIASPVAFVLSQLNLSLNPADCIGTDWTSLWVNVSDGSSMDPGMMEAVLYDYRDLTLMKTNRGRYYTDLFYNNLPEITMITISDPLLLTETHNKLDHYMPLIKKIVEQGSFVLRTQDLRELDDLLKLLQLKASTGLEDLILQLRNDLRNPATHMDFGFKVLDSLKPPDRINGREQINPQLPRK